MSRMARTPRAASAASAHCLQRGPDARALAEQAIDERLLARRGLGLAGARRKHRRRRRGVHDDQRVAVEDADEMRVPLHADALAEQRERDRIERAVDLDVAIGVDRALAGAEERKAVAARGWSARCSTSTKCVQTWRRVVPWMRSRAMVRFQCRRCAFCASRLSKRRPFSALLLT